MYCLIANARQIKNRQCTFEVTRVERQQAASVKFDVRTSTRCRGDIAKFCQNVRDEGGAIHACLQDHMSELSTECRATEFQDLKMIASNSKVNVQLQRACKTDLAKLCSNVADSNVPNTDVQCLMDAVTNEEGGRVSQTCKSYLKRFQKLTREDIALRPRIMRTCAKDIARECTVPRTDVLSCLVDKVDKLLNDDCQELVQNEIAQEARDIDLDPSSLRACQADLDKFCSNLKDDTLSGSGYGGRSGEAHACLRQHMSQLSKSCQATQRHSIRRESTSIRFKPKMLRACRSEMKSLCNIHSPQSAEMLTCLRSMWEDAEMGTACREELIADEAAINADLRADAIFMAQCEQPLRRYCPSVLNEARTPADQVGSIVQ